MFLSLQDILSNKQTRGAFGEIQLNDIVSKALPRTAYPAGDPVERQAGRLPDPPAQPARPDRDRPKFPLEAYEALRAPITRSRIEPRACMRPAVRAHIKAISERTSSRAKPPTAR